MWRIIGDIGIPDLQVGIKWSFFGIEDLSGKSYTILGLFSIQYGYIRKEKS
jgi:hypothetical protein